jgi:glycopeptide antibiotics resistance protein
MLNKTFNYLHDVANRSKWVKGFLLIMYLGFISYFAFVTRVEGINRSYINTYNLLPFYTIGRYLKVNDFSDLIKFVINIMGNIFVFMPVGVFVPFLFPKKDWAYNIINIVSIGFLFSLGVEAIQFIMSVGVFDVDDLILNTIGALFGWKIYTWWKIQKD